MRRALFRVKAVHAPRAADQPAVRVCRPCSARSSRRLFVTLILLKDTATTGKGAQSHAEQHAKQPERNQNRPVWGPELCVPVNSQGVVSGEDLRKHLGVPDSSVLVRDTGSGSARYSLPTGNPAEGERLGAVGRFITAARDTRRLNTELQLLTQVYGEDRVSWPLNQDWVMIRDFPAGGMER